MIVYDKQGKEIKCSEADAKILIASGHFTKSKPKAKQMPLIVEDGSIVDGANSYVSRAEYISYASELGTTIANDANADIELIKAAQYIDHHEANLKGYRTTRNQGMGFPRINVYIDGWYWGGSEIPRNVKLAQMAFALDIHNGIDLYNRPANPNLLTKSEEVVGAVKVEYAVDGANQKANITSTGDSLLSSLLDMNGLQLVRA